MATQRAFNTHNVDVHYNDSDDEDENNFIKLRIKVDNEYYSHYHIDKRQNIVIILFIGLIMVKKMIVNHLNLR